MLDGTGLVRREGERALDMVGVVEPTVQAVAGVSRSPDLSAASAGRAQVGAGGVKINGEVDGRPAHSRSAASPLTSMAPQLAALFRRCWQQLRPARPFRPP